MRKLHCSTSASLMTVENITSSFSPDKTPSDPTVSFAIGAFILAIVFLLGVPGNLFIIWSILVRSRKRSVTTLIILNLVCADGAIMCLTVFFIVYLAKQSWVFGRSMCKLLFYLCNTNMYASIMLITLMSVHRLVTVLRPCLRLHAEEKHTEHPRHALGARLYACHPCSEHGDSGGVPAPVWNHRQQLRVYSPRSCVQSPLGEAPDSL